MPRTKDREPDLLEQLQTLVTASITRTDLLIKERDDHDSTTETILNEMARNSTLLPEALKTAILKGAIPPLEDIVSALVIGAVDCHATLAGDHAVTWNEKRLSRAVLTNNLLSALVLAQGMEQVRARIEKVD